MEHRRCDRRYDRRVPIDFAHEGSSYSSQTRNISLGGVFLETEETLPFGAKVSLRFKVPTQAETIEVEGQVRWLEMDDGRLRGLGVRFEGLRARDVWALNKFFEKPLEEK
ncbi:MAG: PilZ domain-containing protein [Myxococcales bacterium]|nr:PilZ domain-containing protein [Myxococcales bacterium]